MTIIELEPRQIAHREVKGSCKWKIGLHKLRFREIENYSGMFIFQKHICSTLLFMGLGA